MGQLREEEKDEAEAAVQAGRGGRRSVRDRGPYPFEFVDQQGRVEPPGGAGRARTGTPRFIIIIRSRCRPTRHDGSAHPVHEHCCCCWQSIIVSPRTYWPQQELHYGHRRIDYYDPDRAPKPSEPTPPQVRSDGAYRPRAGIRSPRHRDLVRIGALRRTRHSPQGRRREEGEG